MICGWETQKQFVILDIPVKTVEDAFTAATVSDDDTDTDDEECDRGAEGGEM